jgi:hypothetical protein
MRLSKKYQPRYALYLKIKKNPKNWEYMSWIDDMAEKYKKKIGLGRWSGIPNQDEFTEYLKEEVKKILNKKN